MLPAKSLPAKRLLSVAGLLMLSLLASAPAAVAASIRSGSPTVTPTRPGPIALATTGLNIAVPVIIGITLLIMGIAAVAWAFLRTGPSGQRH